MFSNHLRTLSKLIAYKKTFFIRKKKIKENHEITRNLFIFYLLLSFLNFRAVNNNSCIMQLLHKKVFFFSLSFTLRENFQLFIRNDMNDDNMIKKGREKRRGEIIMLKQLLKREKWFLNLIERERKNRKEKRQVWTKRFFFHVDDEIDRNGWIEMLYVRFI